MKQLEKLMELCSTAMQDPSGLGPLQEFLTGKYQERIKMYLEEPLEDLKIDPDLIEELQWLIKSLRTVYNHSGMDTGTSDSEYDILVEKLEMAQEMEEDSEDPFHVTNKGYHLYTSLRGTLDKIYYLSKEDQPEKTSRRTLDDWIKSSEKTIREESGKIVNLKEEPIYVFPKWDGVSVVLEYDGNGNLQRALTRGYTNLNEASIVTGIFRKICSTRENPFDNGKPFGIKTEIMTYSNQLVEYNLEHPENRYKNTRSFASGILNSEIPSIDPEAYLTVVPLRTSYLDEYGESLQVLDKNVFRYPYLRCKLGDLDLIEEFADEHHSWNGLRCDGAVIYLINEELQQILGRKNDRQKFEVAYKFTEEYTYRKVTDVEFRVGMYGAITPVVKFEPVEMKGNMVTCASIGSIGMLRSLNLGEGDVVRVGYDIIPVVTYDDRDPQCKRSRKPRYEIPERCPVCGHELEFGSYSAFCHNNDCPTRMMGRIKSHLDRMNIQFIGISMIEQLFDAGICTSIKDIYKIQNKKKKITDLPGFGKKKFKLMCSEIEKAKDRPIDEAKLFASLCLKDLSYLTYRKLFLEMTGDDLMHAIRNDDVGKIISVKGIGTKTYKRLLKELSKKENQELLDYLYDTLNVHIMNPEKPFFTVVFSSFGKGDVRKEKVLEMVKRQNGMEVPTISKNVDFLVVPDRGIDSNKVKYAKEHNIPIYTADDFIQKTIPMM